MIRILRALAWLRWRQTVNTVRTAWRRGAFEGASRVIGVLLPVLLALAMAPVAGGLAVGAALAGSFVAAGGASAETALIVCRILLLIVTAMVIVAPMVRSMHGEAPNRTRLRLLPIHRGTLRVAEWSMALMDPWLIGLAPALVAMGLGLWLAGAPLAALVSWIAGLALLLALAGAGALLSLLAVWVFRDRRRAEWATMLLLVLLTSAGFVPALLLDPIEGKPNEALLSRLDRVLDWARPLPSELWAGSIEATVDGRPAAAIGHLLGLLVATVLIHAGAEGLDRLLADGGGAAGRRRRSADGRLPRNGVAGLETRTTALAFAHWRSVMRTVRGKLAIYANAPVIVALYFLLGRELTLSADGRWPLGPLALLAGALLTLLSLQPVMLNLFAVDRAGLLLQFLSPLPDRTLIRGKLLGSGLLFAASLALCALGAFVLHPETPPLEWVAAASGALSIFLLFGPMCALISIWLPKTADLARIGRPGNPHSAASLLGLPLLGIASLPCLGLLAWASVAGWSAASTLAAIGAWTVPAALGGELLTRAASHSLGRRRENLGVVASGR